MPIAAFLVASAFVVPPAAPPLAVAYPAAPRLFTVVNASFALAGDNVSVDIFTYAYGNLTDAASLPTVRVWADVQNGASPNLSLQGVTRFGTGHYRGSLVLPPLPSQGVEEVALAIIDANATVAGDPVSGGASLPWLTPGLAVELFANVSVVHPVQPVRLTAELLNRSEPVDADPGSIHIYPVLLDGGFAAPLTPVRAAPGVYQADATLNLTNENGFYANATVGGVPVGRVLAQVPSSSLPSVPYTAFEVVPYQVWFQTLRSGPTGVEGAFWVADAAGHPAAGVALNLYVQTTGVWLIGTTDSLGRFPVNLTGSPGPFRISGTVRGGAGSLQVYDALPLPPCVGGAVSFSSSVVTELDPAFTPEGGLRNLLHPGTTVTRRYGFHIQTITGATEPLGDAPLNYYLSGEQTGTVYVAGHAVTDATGNLSLSFPVPSEDVYLGLDAQGPAGVISSVVAYAVASPEMGLQVSHLTLGGPTRIAVAFGPQGSLYASSGSLAAWAEIGLVTTANGTWARLTGGAGCSGDFLREAASGLNTTIFLPSFLPSSGRYVVSASAWSSDRVVEQFAVLSVGQSVNTPVGGGNAGTATILEWAVAGAVFAAIVAVGVAFLLRRRRGFGPKTKPPPSHP